jgi:hypothetical protein
LPTWLSWSSFTAVELMSIPTSGTLDGLNKPIGFSPSHGRLREINAPEH